MLEGVFGPMAWTGLVYPFEETNYYEREFGTGLQRTFCGFQALVSQDRLVEAKLKAIELEREWSILEKRRLNLDPGLLTPERLVLATRKNFTHRIYLGSGVFADLTLIFQAGSFRPLPWSYPDYAASESIAFWNEVRRMLLRRINWSGA